MRGLRAVALCVVLSVIGATSANAQDDGVTVDPQSPSGKEYAIPLESARRQADPTQGRDTRPKPSSAALFGAGIAPRDRPGTGSTAGRERSTARSNANGQSRKDRPADRKVPAIVDIATSRPGAPEAGVGPSALFVALGLLVLVVGAVAGLLVRRRARA